MTNNMNNYKEIFEKMIIETENYLNKYGLKCMVLGISGGIDSTVTAAICHEVEKRNPKIRFIGVSLPCSSNSTEENDSANVCMKGFCKSGNCWVENLQKEYMLMKSTCEIHSNSTYISQGNIKARLRMIYLYNLASINNGIVMDTDNLTEHYLGFFTIHGDVADFNPIGNLWKHEIYELAKYILFDYYKYDGHSGNLGYKEMALKAAIGITPTDGNGVNDLGDIGQIAPEFAFDNNIDAYTKVDEILSTYIEYRGHHPEEFNLAMNNIYAKYNKDTVDGIINRCKKTEYKRNRLPIVPNI